MSYKSDPKITLKEKLPSYPAYGAPHTVSFWGTFTIFRILSRAGLMHSGPQMRPVLVISLSLARKKIPGGGGLARASGCSLSSSQPSSPVFHRFHFVVVLFLFLIVASEYSS